MPAVGDAPYAPALGDTPCGFASDLLVCRRVGVHLLTFGAVALCCFRGGRGCLAQKSGLAVHVYLRFLFITNIRSSNPSSIWSAFGLQPRPRFVRAGREHLTSS